MARASLSQVRLPEDMIHLGMGEPGSNLLPRALLADASARVMAGDGADYLAYGAVRGNPGFRESLAEFLTRETLVRVTRDQLLITNGNSQGLDMVCTLFTRPGDTVLVESHTYFHALTIFKDHGLTLLPVPTDEQGLRTDCLEALVREHCPIFLYTIPFFNNPGSMTLPVARQRELARISQQYGLNIVSDEAYWFLHFDRMPPPSLGQFLDTCPVICLGSFSKILAPGLRLGWIHASPATLKAFTASGLLRSGGGLNPFTSAVVDEVVRSGQLKQYIQWLNQVFSARARALSQALRDNLPMSISFDSPEGGYFVWLKLPDEVDTLALRKAAQRLSVDYYPGVFFSPDNAFTSHMRLSFAMYDEARLKAGAERLSRVLEMEHPGIFK